MKRYLVSVLAAVFFLSNVFYVQCHADAADFENGEKPFRENVSGETATARGLKELAGEQLWEVFVTDGELIYHPLLEEREVLSQEREKALQRELERVLGSLKEEDILYYERFDDEVLEEGLFSPLPEQGPAERMPFPAPPAEEEEVLRLTLPEVREKALENSREAQRARLGLEQLDIAVEMAEEQHEEMEDLQEMPEDLRDDLEQERIYLRHTLDDVYLRLAEILRDMAEEEANDEDENDNDDVNNDENGEDNEKDNQEAENSTENEEEKSNPASGEKDTNNARISQDSIQDNPLEPHPDDLRPDALDVVGPEWTEIQDLMVEAAELQAKISMIEYAELLLGAAEEAAEEIDEDILGNLVEEAEQAKREVRQDREIAQMEWEKNKELIQFGAEAQYVGLLSLQEQKEMEGAAVESAESELQKEKLKKEQGVAVDLQVDRLKLELQEAEDRLESLENDYEELERELLASLGKSQEDYDRVELEGINYRLDWFESRFQVEEKKEQVPEEGQDILIAEKRLEHAEENKAWSKDHHGDDSSEYEMAKTEVEQAKLDLEEAEEDSVNRLLEAHNHFEESMNETKQAGEARELAEEMFRGEELQEELGLSSEHEVLQAKAEKKQVTGAAQLAEYQAYLAKRELELLGEGILLQNGLQESPGEPGGAGAVEIEDTDEMEEMHRNDFEAGSGDPGTSFPYSGERNQERR